MPTHTCSLLNYFKIGTEKTQMKIEVGERDPKEGIHIFLFCLTLNSRKSRQCPDSGK